MAGDENQRVRPGWRRRLKIIGFGALLGPPIGGLALGLIQGLAAAFKPEASIVGALAGGISMGANYATLAYIPGLIPALLAGVAISVASRRIRSRKGRLAAAALLGAAATGLFLGPLIHSSGAGSPPLAETAAFLGPVVLAGAVAAFVLTAVFDPWAEGPQSPSNSAVER